MYSCTCVYMPMYLIDLIHLNQFNIYHRKRISLLKWWQFLVKSVHEQQDERYPLV